MRRSLARGRGLAFAVGVATALMVACAVAAAPAAADESLQVAGSITYTWQGDPSLGCGAVGVCDVQGALTVEPQGTADVQKLGKQTIINLEGGSATVRVLTGTGANATECIDSPSNVPDVSVFVSGSTGKLEPAVSSGRCAGPLGSDLSRVTLPVRRSAGKHPSYDLSVTRTFAAGPFLVTLASTLVMRPGGGSGSSNTNSGSFTGTFFGGPPSGRRALVEHVTLRYRLRALPDPLTISFSGESGPFCAVIDSCGATGDVAMTPARPSKTLTLTGSRTISQPESDRQVMADLRHGRIKLQGAAAVQLEASETIVRADGSRCQDSAPKSAVLTVGAVLSHARMGVVLAQAGEEVDPVRTHCPGPEFGDVFGSGGLPALARAPIGIAQLLARHGLVNLSNPGGFSGPGYVGSRGGAVGFSLALESIHAGTRARTR